MKTNLAFASLIGAALLSSAAAAQSTGGNGQPAATGQQAQTQPGAQDNGAPAGDNFVTKQSINEWRAPKLVGVGVYGSDGKKIGAIKDVLIDHDGKAQVVVVGVGGVLGIGSKDVGLPFAAFHWRTEGRAAPRTDQPPANGVSSMTGGPTSPAPVMRADPAATEANQGYPDKAMVDMTFAQLKSAPDFNYAPDPLADADMRSSAPGGSPQRTTTP
jgi:PRC-barrel domain